MWIVIAFLLGNLVAFALCQAAARGDGKEHEDRERQYSGRGTATVLQRYEIRANLIN
jgi:hypothetical protein